MTASRFLGEQAASRTAIVAEPVGGLIAILIEPGRMILILVRILAAPLVRRNQSFGRYLFSSSLAVVAGPG